MKYLFTPTTKLLTLCLCFVLSATVGCSIESANNPEIWEEVRVSLRDRRPYAMVRRSGEVAYLAKALKDPSWIVRYNAAQDLRKLGSGAKEAVPALIECFDDRQAKVSGMCYRAVRDIGISREEDVRALASRLSSQSNKSRMRAVTLLSGAGQEASYASPELIAALGSFDSSFLGKVKEIILGLEREQVNEESFRLAVFSSGDDSQASIDVQLLKALSGANPKIRQRAAVLLGKRSVKEAVPSLEQMLDASNAETRLSAASALAFLNGSENRDELLAILRGAMNSPDAEVRESTAEALRELGDLETVRSYQVSRASAQAATRAKASKGKNRVGASTRSGGISDAKIASIAHLVRVRLVTEYVERITPGQIKRWKSEIPSFQRDLHAIDPNKRQIAVANLLGMAFYVPEAKPVLQRALQSQDARVRRAASLALGQLRLSAAVPELTSLLADSAVRESAAAALLEIGSGGAEGAVRAQSEELDMTLVGSERARIQRGKRLENLPGVGVAEARELCRLLLIDAGLAGRRLDPAVESCVRDTKAQF